MNGVPTPEDPAKIVLGREIRRSGLLPDHREHGEPFWALVRRGAYYPAAEWADLDGRARHALLVHASVRLWHAPAGPISHWSAAAVWGLPIVGPWPRRVHLTVDHRHRRSQHCVQLHQRAVLPVTRRVGEVEVTDPTRTVIDLARSVQHLRTVLPAADQALRHHLTTPVELIAAADALPAGSRGRRMARLVARLADGRAESVLESLSRAVIFGAGFPKPELQAPLVDGDGEFGFADFGWEGLFGECDGELKYGADLSDGDPSAAVWREKRREDRMRRLRDVARWSWNDAHRTVPLCAQLTEKGLPRTGPDTWFPSGDCFAVR